MIPEDDGGGEGTTSTCSPLVGFASSNGFS